MVVMIWRNCVLCKKTVLSVLYVPTRGTGEALYKNFAPFITNLLSLIPQDLIESKEMCGCYRWNDIIVFFLHLNETGFSREV